MLTEPNANQSKIEGELVKSIKDEKITKLATDYTELGLDSILDDGVTKDIPILRTCVSLARVGLNIRDKLYTKKIFDFLCQISNTTQEQREDFIWKYCQDIRRFENAVLLILEQADSIEKSTLIGKIFRACILDKINYDEALKLSSMVNRVFWGDLKELINNVNVKIDEHNQSLVMAGLFIITDSPGFRGHYDFGGIKYKITKYGECLIQIAKT